MSGSDRRRLVRFAMIRQQLCPLCGNYICFNNKEKVYKCKNENCSYVVEKEKSSISLTENSSTEVKSNTKKVEEIQIIL